MTGHARTLSFGRRTPYRPIMGSESHPPAPDRVSLDRSDADAKAGRTVPFANVRAELEASIEQTRARLATLAEAPPSL